MKSEIPKFYQESEELRNPMMRWKYLKYKVRDFSKQYSVDKARERKAKPNKLELRVKELDVLISSNAKRPSFRNTMSVSINSRRFIIT